jgi:hypothetical protein
MSEVEADQVMSEALALDNEIRFRLPDGLRMRARGDVLSSTDEAALAALIAYADDSAMAIAMAGKLGVGSHDIMRQHALALTLSLRRGGVQIEWESAPTAAMAVTAPMAPPHSGLGP